MRGRAIAALLFGLTGCGRIGYEEIATSGDADDAIDASDGPEPGIAAECNVPVQILELPVPVGKRVTALELGATTAGFVVVWSIEDAVWASGFDVSATHRFSLNQTGGEVAGYGTEHVSIGSVGNDAVLAIDNVAADAIYFYPLAETGYSRGATKVADLVHGHGNDFLVADPSERVFGVAAVNTTGTVTLEREIDSHPWTDPVATFATIVAENTGITRLGDGYAVISGRASNCNVTAVDDLLAPIGTAQTMDMTCHNATIANAGGDKIVAAWNCDNDRVWLTGGPLTAALPAYRELYGDATHIASNPRLAPTTAGVWYGFQVDGGRLGRALVDGDGANLASVTPDVVVAGGVGDFDLVSRADQAFLFWTEPATTTTLWTMRLCAP